MESTKEQAVIPQSLITEGYVREALKADKGSEALLKSWKVVDFTKRGDNYACAVTSVEVKYTESGVEHEVSYIVKLNSCRAGQGVPDFSPVIFSKEGRFYQEVVPVLNEMLISAGQEALRVPKCFFVSLESGKEQLYLEDLRARDFKMFDRRKGMDYDHASLVLSELARLHSASYLLLKKLKEGESLSTKFDFISDEYLFSSDLATVYETFMKTNVDTGIKMLETIGGYESSIEWLRNFKEEVPEICSVGTQSKKYTSICHGDCWNNNVLFRYNDEGRPVELMLVDLQIGREASFAYDLNYFLYTSLTGDVRGPNIENFLTIYFSSYKEVLKGADMPMYFDKEELVKEFRSKNKLGLLFSMGIIPALLAEPEEAPEFIDQDIEKFMLEMKRVAFSLLKTNPLCKPRFLSIFDEFLESGLIS
ncbi:uncharacterized protein [Macrobrachium rosenbergii]|uniref:uncharacterized protein isoform X3 n=1 Tax=Macrobrachium rosenbergii TaxID=79674 RepID=UPI0034D6E8D6